MDVISAAGPAQRTGQDPAPAATVTGRPLPPLGPPVLDWARSPDGDGDDQPALPDLGGPAGPEPFPDAEASPERSTTPTPAPTTAGVRPAYVHDRWDGPVPLVDPPGPERRRSGSDLVSTSSVPGLPDPERWSRWLAGLVVEVVHGRRPAVQLARWTDERALATVVLRSRQLRRDRARATLLAGSLPAGRVAGGPATRIGVRVQRPSAGAVEVAVVVGGPAPTAMALRLEGRGERWLCTALDFGPQTPQPG
ncbi:hypothetical protein FHX74_002955 [Friedmanniella endophytica]|uniref:Uncharacterized protein n=1 Tax=Microlunatus kandeliicorticis TaxID=1759536 RepID=A0A7W3P6V3_9ACTN|nr:Rv3235 family protein [Microlunatus kandeliicorticis]MBA8795327.1 hypothetical protein [Microlunatus kandeliicorticis]